MRALIWTGICGSFLLLGFPLCLCLSQNFSPGHERSAWFLALLDYIFRLNFIVMLLTFSIGITLCFSKRIKTGFFFILTAIAYLAFLRQVSDT